MQVEHEKKEQQDFSLKLVKAEGMSDLGWEDLGQLKILSNFKMKRIFTTASKIRI